MSETTPAPAAPVPETTPKQKIHKSLNYRQRERACMLWQVGDLALEEIAKQFDVTGRTLQKLFKKRGIQKGDLKDRITDAAKKEVERITREQSAALAGKKLVTREELHAGARFFQKLIVKLGVESMQAGVSISTKRAEIQTCRDALAGIKLAQEIHFPVLGITEQDGAADEGLPELPVIVLTDEDIRAQQRARQSDLGDFTPQDMIAATKELDAKPLPAAVPEKPNADPGPGK